MLLLHRNINNLFEREKEKENYYSESKWLIPVRANNFWSNNYIEHKSNSDKNRMWSVEEYLDKIRPYLKDVINDLKKFSPRKINFISSRDDYDEERVMHSKTDNIEIMISDEADQVMKRLFDSLKNRYKKK